jgi:hypothetical protein
LPARATGSTADAGKGSRAGFGEDLLPIGELLGLDAELIADGTGSYLDSGGYATGKADPLVSHLWNSKQKAKDLMLY